MKRLLFSITLSALLLLTGCKKMEDSSTWDSNPFDPKFKHKEIANVEATWTPVTSGGSSFVLGAIQVSVDMSEFTNGVGGCKHYCKLKYLTYLNTYNDSYLMVDANDADINTFTYNIGQAHELQDVVFQYQLMENGNVLHTQEFPLHIPAF